MKKSEYENFQNFKKRNKLTTLQIINIMTEYANTVDTYTASFFATKYHISENVFYKMRDYTIVFMLVPQDICKKIRNKTFRNQSGKNKSGNYTSAHHHYKQLIEKRKEYLKSFSDEEITVIAIEYANRNSLTRIAHRYNISVYTAQKLLAIALVRHLVSEEIYLRIKSRCEPYISQDYSGYTVEDLWKKYSHWE